MAFLSGKQVPDEGDFSDISDQPTEPTLHRMMIDAAIRRAKREAAEQQRVCPVCVYYAEARGERVEVGLAQLRICAGHMEALEEADTETKPILSATFERAFRSYFWPESYRSSAEADRVRQMLLRGLADWSTHDDGS